MYNSTALTSSSCIKTMTPENRKTTSETLLHKRGIRINLQLPLTESDEEVRLRSNEEVLRRMVALWCVSGAAADAVQFQRFRAYVGQHGIADWLSAAERGFLLHDAGYPAADEVLRASFMQRKESLFFLAWCAGLVRKIDLPGSASSLKAVLSLLPQQDEAPGKLQAAVKLRSKREILGWADLLYRLHWAVRHANLIGKPVPGNLDAVMVQQWHQAVNWVIGYDDENDWDLVGTDT
ncbi:DUF4272 domain-containing protein [Undibacterium sp.]|jgi:hypothetical protein|uniref:DUF4272 domain-containing protein n=1 Tax=Undibacterium sp. TaxID=1914977 RepID=UPI002BCA4C92|nr:DUF4272 domain-containing protein [Undibacterium sp.]HTD04363.1 DUF4272 domain-containing protein [Undibacterium sp.]